MDEGGRYGLILSTELRHYLFVGAIYDVQYRLFCTLALEFEQSILAVVVDARVLLDVVSFQPFHDYLLFYSF